MKKEIEVIIDRFEGNFAICEIDEGKFINVEKEKLPNTREGDSVKIVLE